MLIDFQISDLQIIKFITMGKITDFQKSIHGMNENDLKAKIKGDELRLKKLQFAHAISPLENPMNLRNLRRDVARLKTELKKKEIGV